MCKDQHWSRLSAILLELNIYDKYSTRPNFENNVCNDATTMVLTLLRDNHQAISNLDYPPT